MGDRFLILNTDYPEFIRWFYTHQPGFEAKSYQEQLKARMESLFGIADFYSSNLEKLDHKAVDIIYNHQALQKQWAIENASYLNLYYLLSIIPGVNTLSLRMGRGPLKQVWLNSILEKQIEQFRPEVIYNIAMESVRSDLLKRIKRRYPSVKMIIGQHAAPITNTMQDLSGYDLILSSLPNQVAYFRKKGAKAEYFKLGFGGKAILARLKRRKEQNEAVFIGGIGGFHSQRTILLENVAQVVPGFKIWGYGLDNLPEGSPIRSCYQEGPLFGLGMYEKMYNSKIVINCHIDIAEDYANNMRLYEATGVGALLITDEKKNLADIFRPDKEVVVYKTPEECIDKIKYYLTHEKERQKIAKAGQKRTLREHTDYQRMEKLLEIIKKYL